MKNSTTRRLLALLLSLMMIFPLSPTALLADPPGDSGTSADGADAGTDADGSEEDGDDDGEDGEETTPSTPSGPVKALQLKCDELRGSNGSYELDLEPKSDSRGVRITAALEPANSTTDEIRVIWKSDNEDVATVSEDQGSGTGRTVYIYGRAPGKATITAEVQDTDIKYTIAVTVSGIKILTTDLSLLENESKQIVKGTDYELYGRAASEEAKLSVSIVNNKPNVYAAASGTTVMVEGRQAGDATVILKVESGGSTYEGEIHVTVKANVSVIPWTAGVSPAAPLKFADLENLLNRECQNVLGESLRSVTGLTVSTAEGTIYHGYNSPDDTGSGAGSSITYYASSAARGPYIRDLTFVPNPSFGGEKATITFTGTGSGDEGRTFKGRIEVTITDAKSEELTLTTRSDVPLKLKAEDFAKVCQEQTGGSLDYVIFTLPPADKGVLYRDYKNELDYAAKVTAAEQFNRKGLDDVTFVPTRGYIGPVTIGYAGYSTTGVKYTGELVINITRPLDESIQYQDYGSGSITFSGGDFDAYCEAMTRQPMRQNGYVSFTPPPASQGTLYRTGNTSAWNAVASGDTFTQTALSRVTFVAAEGFDGVVRIPFTGKDWQWTEFSGTVELHIQANSSSVREGDVFYTCQPSQSVKLVLADFANLCQSTTGARLYYVTFQALPDYTQGSLFYNRTSSGAIGTRVTTTTKYFNSAAPYISNLSFWAGANFRSVEIPFTLAAVSGETFTGLLVISSGEGAGGGRAGAVTYTTTARQPVTFSGTHFDAASRQATNSALGSLRFSLPSSGQGILYYDYREGVTPKALDSSTALYLTGEVSVDKVTFVPASGFSGVVHIPYSAASINGTAFQGTVEITVRAGAAYGSIVRYNTGGEPLRFQSSDLAAASGGGQPSSIRFTGLPSSSQGRIYYQYSGVTKYSWLGNTTVSYSISGDPSVSNLTFIPRAGYEGVVTIPYAATGYDGTTSAGSIEITVTLPTVSKSFDDLKDYSAQTNSAVDYLSSMGVVNGTGYRTYDPGASILRGDFCLMLSRAFQFDVGGTGRTFSDVPYDSYYAKAITEMYALGVVNGVGGGRFQPTANISRQDAAVMVRRALDKAGLTLPDGSNEAALTGYQDRGQVDNYARDALGSLVRTGIFPVSEDRLSPKAAITRAEMAVLLHRAMTNFS